MRISDAEMMCVRPHDKKARREMRATRDADAAAELIRRNANAGRKTTARELASVFRSERYRTTARHGNAPSDEEIRRASVTLAMMCELRPELADMIDLEEADR